MEVSIWSRSESLSGDAAAASSPDFGDDGL